jgi:hypothetical protein
VPIKSREGVREKSRDGVKRYLPHVLVIGTYLLLSVQLFSLISRYAVNVLFSDQWEFDDATLFQQHSTWEMFRWQHGQHRQGLGALSQKLIEPYIHWNSHYEAFGIGAIIVIAALVALLLKVRLYGAIRYSDVVIPCLFLTPRQWESVVLTANPTHAFLPLLLILYCLCWLIPAYYWKYTCVLLVNFLLIYNGYGIFVGFLTPALLALHFFGNTLHLAPKYQWVSAAALTISIASLASFFVGYKFQSGVDCFSLAPENPVLYLWFVALMFTHAAGLNILSITFATLAGSIALLLLLVGLWVVVKRLFVAQAEDTWSRDTVIAALLAYCVVFCLNAAYGRLCLGLAAAATSRYTPYVVFGFFGLYLYALSDHARNLCAYLVLVLVLFATLGARPLSGSDARIVKEMTNSKRAWRECYLGRHDIRECDNLTKFQVHPHPEGTHLREKLDFLERNHLNLYADSQ